MGSKVSRLELEEGTCVVGKKHSRVEMPAGVVGQQLPGGPMPAKHVKVPRLLGELLDRNKARDIYAATMAAIAAEAGGNAVWGWNSKQMAAVVDRLQPEWNAKGIGLAYSMVQWYVSHGDSGHTEYRYWFEYTPIQHDASAVAAVAAVAAVVASPPKIEPSVATATPALQAGSWIAQLGVTVEKSDLPYDVHRLKYAVVVLRESSGVLSGDVEIRAAGFVFPWTRTARGVVRPLGPDQGHELRDRGHTFHLKLLAPDKLLMTLPPSLLNGGSVPLVPGTMSSPSL